MSFRLASHLYLHNVKSANLKALLRLTNFTIFSANKATHIIQKAFKEFYERFSPYYL